ncbi:ABC transporter ATP-binding protein [Saccharopolyspora erythraea]|uniref:ABC transporter ATP-binding protein n=1 Tax=Saccharopolyspora erythraea TaxID=1836 RepID=UPI001BF06269|nr:ABC transporter ATP-binding protein [Saccharopolyspora erythraea]QUH03888.1 ABC transporter ATP-binding protein [Saccharopolyspora erythraea]
MSLVELGDLTVTIAGAASPILRGVDLRVGAGEIVGLVGESGSGKSTTALSIVRMLPSSAAVSGRIAVDGRDVLGMKPAALRELRTRTVGVVQQEPRAAFNPLRPVGYFLTEQLCTNLRWSAQDARARVVGLMHECGLREPERMLARYPHELSGGMLQRLVIAAALAVEPELLLADEATSALDVTTQAEIIAILSRMRRERGLGILFITHDLPLAAAFCDRVAVMRAGEVVEEQAARELFAHPESAYTAELLAAVPVLEEEGERA